MQSGSQLFSVANYTGDVILRDDFYQEIFIAANFHIRLCMAGQLKVSTSLSRKKTERNHFALFVIRFWVSKIPLFPDSQAELKEFQ